VSRDTEQATPQHRKCISNDMAAHLPRKRVRADIYFSHFVLSPFGAPVKASDGLCGQRYGDSIDRFLLLRRTRSKSRGVRFRNPQIALGGEDTRSKKIFACIAPILLGWVHHQETSKFALVEYQQTTTYLTRIPDVHLVESGGGKKVPILAVE